MDIPYLYYGKTDEPGGAPAPPDPPPNSRFADTAVFINAKFLRPPPPRLRIGGGGGGRLAAAAAKILNFGPKLIPNRSGMDPESIPNWS